MISQRLRRRSIRFIAVIAAVTLAVACGGGDVTNPDGTGATFSATVSGGSAGSYSGLASAAQSAGLFSIGLATADGKFALAFTRNGSRPAAGTYQLGTNALTGFTAALNVNTGQFVYSSTSGTLTITSSSSAEITGSFQFIGSPSFGAGAAASVSGSFTATCPVGC